MGESITEADVRLFTTLVRFDVVYHGHFKCNRQKLTELPALWGYARDLFQTAGFGDTVDFDQIKRHYYVVHGGINPTGIVPRGPDLSAVAGLGLPGAMGHDHGHAAGRAADRTRLRIVLAVTVCVLVLEVVGWQVTGSLALLADAGHMATDAAAVVLALGASYVATLKGGPRSTFGLHRAEVLAALVNSLVLLGVCGYLLYAGISRLSSPEPVDAGPMVAFATVGLVANGISMVVLARAERSSLNMRGAINEVLADLLGSLLAVIAGIVIWTTGYTRADSIATLMIAVLILPRAFSLARDATVVLLEIAPRGLDLDDVRTHLLGVPGVTDVHDLHAWTITSGIPSLSAHVTVTDACLAERGVGATLDELSKCVADHFDVHHATFQVEPATHREHEDLGEVH